MAVNMALKRAKKAARRKAALAERGRTQALDTSLAGRVRVAASSLVYHCLVSEGLFENGIGTLTLARGIPGGQFSAAVFLLDTFCLGVKDAFFRRLSAEDLVDLVEAINATDRLVSVEPDYARKLLLELVAWSRSLGLAPHPDFAVVETLFGDVSAAACDATFQFGCDGKVLYVPGPTESPTMIRRRIELLRKRLGDDGLELVTTA
jgi:hypothetical protein